MRARIKFSKTGPLIYVGHLDLLRFFQKAFRRAGVDIAYTNGYSPHQMTSFAAPLGIGVSSEGEYLDAEFHTVESSERMLARLNKAFQTPYIRATSFIVLEENAKKAMAAVAGADYRISAETSFPEWNRCQSAVEEFLLQTTIPVLKKTKKSEMLWDIRPFIHQLKADGPHIVMRLTTGSVNNLKPESVMESLTDFCHIPVKPSDYRIHRLETLLWREDTKTFAPLFTAGHEV